MPVLARNRVIAASASPEPQPRSTTTGESPRSRAAARDASPSMSVRPTPRERSAARASIAAFESPAAGRAAILRLQQVDVAAARDVVRMTGRACPRAVATLERQRATADTTGERRTQRIV